MKKRFALLIAAVMLANLVNLVIPGAASAQDTDWQQLYAQYIREHYEKPFSDSSAAVMYLVDLDLDGTPELLGGSDSMTHSPVTVAVTVRQGKVTPLAQSGGGLSGDSQFAGFSIGLPAFQHMKLYRHENGAIYYIGTDVVFGADDDKGCEYEISLKSLTVETNAFACSSHPKWDYEGAADTYQFAGQEVSKEAYERQKQQYYAQLTELDARVYASSYDLYDNSAERVNESVLQSFLQSYRAPGAANRTSASPSVSAGVGKFAIAPQFERVLNFSDGLATVRQDGKWGTIDRNGNFVARPEYDWIIQYTGSDLANVVKDRKGGFIDRSGKLVIDFIYGPDDRGNAGNSFFSEGLAAVYQDGKGGYIDQSGKVVIPLQFDRVQDFRDGQAIVRQGERWMIIDKSGQPLLQIDGSYDLVENFSSGLAAVRKDLRSGFIDTSGKLVIPLTEGYYFSFINGLAGYFSIDKKYGFIDRSGKQVIPPIYDELSFVFWDGLAAVKKDGKAGFINVKGEAVIPLQYEDVDMTGFREGLAAVKIGGKWGYIDQQGNVIIAPQFDKAQAFSEGLAPVRIGDRWGYIEHPLGPVASKPAEPNIKFDYPSLSEAAATETFLKHLDDTLAALIGESPNRGGIAAIAEFIEYALQAATQESAKAEQNTLTVSGGTISRIADALQSATQQFDDVLQKYDVYLHRSLERTIRLQAEQIDLANPYTILIDQTTVDEAGDADGILISLDGNAHSVYVTIEHLRSLFASGEAAAVQISRNSGEDSYNITFLDASGQSVDQVSIPFTFTVPAESELASIFAQYKGGSDNWGGQYDPVAQSLRFSTRFSGTYNVLNDPIHIADIAELPEDAQKAIQFMVSKGYFELNGDAFGPGDPMNRNQFTMALVNMFFALDRSLTTSFSDVAEGDPYYSYIASAEAGDIVEGFEGGTFRGDLMVTREQIIAMAGRTLVEKKGYIYPDSTSQLRHLADYDAISEWALPDIALAVQAGLIAPGLRLDPQAAPGRAEAAEILYKLFMLLYETPPAEVAAAGAEAQTTEPATDSAAANDAAEEAAAGRSLSSVGWAAAVGGMVILLLAGVLLYRKKKYGKWL